MPNVVVSENSWYLRSLFYFNQVTGKILEKVYGFLLMFPNDKLNVRLLRLFWHFRKIVQHQTEMGEIGICVLKTGYENLDLQPGLFKYQHFDFLRKGK